MANIREWNLLKVVAGTVLLALLGFGVSQWWASAHRPLGEFPRVEFPKTQITSSERERFLDGEFSIVKDVKALPRPVLQVFTEERGARLLMANPGETFNATDVIYDKSIPQERLIFAGVARDKCFVFYEQGGIGHTYILAFFVLTPKETAQPFWRGYCEPVANLQDLRARVRSGHCSEPVPQGMLR